MITLYFQIVCFIQLCCVTLFQSIWLGNHFYFEKRRNQTFLTNTGHFYFKTRSCIKMKIQLMENESLSITEM